MIPDTIYHQSKAGHVQQQIRWAQGEDARLLMHGDRQDPTYLPYMPYQLADFTAVMFECVAELNGPKFLDVGCGTGTKMTIARELFGLMPYGIERDQAMAKNAKHRGTVMQGDALDFPDYRVFDLIWLYRPFRDPDKESSLEGKIMAQAKSGAILAGGAWEICPQAVGWNTIVDDWGDGMRRGAWQKP